MGRFTGLGSLQRADFTGSCEATWEGMYAGPCLKGTGAIRAVAERLQSGHRGCQSGWGVGGYWRLEMRLGAGVGVWECLWGRVSAVSTRRGPPHVSLYCGCLFGLMRHPGTATAVAEARVT